MTLIYTGRYGSGVHIMILSTRALVLRETKYKETDKILTVITEDDGKQTVCARGVMSKSSKIAAACQLLTFSEMTFSESYGKLYVKEAQPVEQFLGLREDISYLALGAYFAELLETVSDEDSPTAEILRLGLNSLFALSNKLYKPEHIKAVFELRLMCVAGFEPNLESCPACGKDSPEKPVFSTSGGTVLCGNCRSEGYGETLLLDTSALAAMRHICTADSKRIFSFSIDEKSEKRLAAACEAYAIAQLDRRVSSLDYWKAVK